MELQQRLDRLVADRNKYQCEYKEANEGKRVIALLGASAVGKSTLIQACLQNAPSEQLLTCAEAGTTGTRAPRVGDPDNYHMGTPLEEAVELIEKGRPVNWSLMPTGDIYMTLPEDFPADYNFMACLPDSLPMLKRAGFEMVHALYIATDADSWEEQIAARMYTADSRDLPKEQRVFRPDALGRVEEAISSIEHAQSSRSFLRILNTPGQANLQKNVEEIWNIVREKSTTYSRNATQLHEFEVSIGSMYSRAIDLSYEIRQASEK